MANRNQIPSLEAIGFAVRAEQAKRTFDNSPDPAALIELHQGDPSKTSMELLIHLLSLEEFQREALRRQGQRRREELAGPDPSAIERTLADRVVVCEFDLSYYNICVIKADIFEQKATAELYDRRRHRAHKRLMSALRTLAIVRRLGLPETQAKVGPGLKIKRS
jgi:hypothetical protein